MKNKRRHFSGGKSVLYLFMALLSCIWVYPFVWMVTSSFKTQPEFFRSKLKLIPEGFYLENFIRAWKEANFSAYFKNSLIVTVAVVLIVLFVTSLAGYVLGRYEFRGKKLVIALLMLSAVVPATLTIIPVYEVLKQLNLSQSLMGLILAEAGGGHVIFIMLFYGFFSSIPKELEEAATLDGCGPWKLYTSIMLPLAKPITGTVVIMQGIWTWNSFLLPLVLTLNNPKLRTLSVGLYVLRGENVVDWTGITAGACIAVVPVIIIFIAFQKYFVNGMAGSVKS